MKILSDRVLRLKGSDLIACSYIGFKSRAIVETDDMISHSSFCALTVSDLIYFLRLHPTLYLNTV